MEENQRKRKSYFGSAEKERKCHKNTSPFSFGSGKTRVFNPNVTSSAEKSETRRKNESTSRRKLPLSEINGNSKSQRKTKAIALPLEKDERKLATRQRQIDIGKNTVGYKLYTEDVKRMDRTTDHPWTPNKFTVCSTRSWQGTMRIWRRKLHYWDPTEMKNDKDTFFDSTLNTIETQKKSIDHSMELDDCPSSESSQASSNDDLFDGPPKSDSWYQSNEDIFKIKYEDEEEQYLYQQCY
ncbi:histone RNA hairpin-binding protein-like [Clytia hemisphaerica]|uniref:histone RNA hairpin-binding protein-like n=1 Tax=Clytia hemisphaerica TaxID=252671 RepID=UPI0034D394EB